jgi:DNA topoisomerase-1
MEELGIGRPSTYASILQVIRDRGYVRIDKKRLVPEDKGRVVVGFLESFFAKYVEYDFTAGLEEQLDRVSNNELEWQQVLRDFWRDFTAAIDSIKDLRVSEVLDALNDLLAPHVFPARADGGDPRQCPVCGTGQLSLKLGKFGAFIGCSNYPECRNTRQLTPGAEGSVSGTTPLGKDPVSGLEVTLRAGRFGPYVQLGEAEGTEKPKRAGLPKGTDASSVDLEMALKLLSLPREVGKHPETGEPIMAGIGRFGPYVQHQKTYANLESAEDVHTVGINHAVTLIAEKVAKGPSKRRFGADPGKPLGDHPEKGGPIVAKNGRYGAYVSHNGVSATLPKDKTPDTITLAEAAALIDERAGQSGGTARARRAPARKAATPARKPASAATPKPKAKAKNTSTTKKAKPAAKKAAG